MTFLHIVFIFPLSTKVVRHKTHIQKVGTGNGIDMDTVFVPESNHLRGLFSFMCRITLIL